MVTNLKGRTPGGKIRLGELVAQMTNEFLGYSVNVGNRFEPKVMIALERFHRFLLGFEKRSDDQLACLE